MVRKTAAEGLRKVADVTAALSTALSWLTRRLDRAAVRAEGSISVALAAVLVALLLVGLGVVVARHLVAPRPVPAIVRRVR